MYSFIFRNNLRIIWYYIDHEAPFLVKSQQFSVLLYLQVNQILNCSRLMPEV